MTDALAAFAAVPAQLPCRDALMQENHQQAASGRSGDGINGLFCKPTSPAGERAGDGVRSVQHRSFTMSNPNRIRSLIGAFAGSNPAAFDAEDGAVTSSWWKCLPTSQQP
ncbi:aminopeptidase N C-terminal domain-containing protein [Shigella flexneri]